MKTTTQYQNDLVLELNITLAKNPDVCPDCHKSDFIIDESTGERVCVSCGLVLERIVSRKPEWSQFEDYSSKVRAEPTTQQFKGLTRERNTLVNPISYGLNGKQDPVTIANFQRLDRTYTMVNSGQLSLSNEQAIKSLSRYKSILNLPNIVCEHTKDLYLKCVKADIVAPGQSVDAVLLVCLYIAIRNYELPITVENLSKASNESISSKRIFHLYHRVVKTLNIRPAKLNPSTYISKFVNTNNLSGEFEVKVTDIVKAIISTGKTNGSNPRCIVACAIYIASKQLKERHGQSEIAKACGISDVALRTHIRRCKSEFGLTW
jgi:transcription initiation factor TFIIB